MRDGAESQKLTINPDVSREHNNTDFMLDQGHSALINDENNKYTDLKLKPNLKNDKISKKFSKEFAKLKGKSSNNVSAVPTPTRSSHARIS